MTEDISGYQRLAVNVIEQAIRDLNHRTARVRKNANHFLFGDGDRTYLEHWAEQAGLQPAEVVRQLRRTTPEQLSKALASQRVRRD